MRAPAAKPHRQATPIPLGLKPEVRRPRFDFARDGRVWFKDDPLITHFFNGLSMTFPAGERFFVKSVAHFLNVVHDPELKEQIAAFSSQEGSHSAQHHSHNVAAAGKEGAVRDEKYFNLLIDRISAPRSRLLITACMEHLTAVLSNLLLTRTGWLDAMDPEHRKIWAWHALEELEHKGVAFDVYRAVGGGYLHRVHLFLLATLWWFAVPLCLMVSYLRRDGELFKIRNLRSFLKVLLYVSGAIPDWLTFLRPGFHPWQNDNSALLAAWKRRYVSEIAGGASPAAA